MGAIADAFATTYRAFNTDGVPASGAYEPAKSDIVALGALLESTLTQVAQGAGATVFYGTRAALYADLAHAAGTIAMVFADPDPLLSGFYVKAGASGAGSWSLTDMAYSATLATVLATVQPLVDAAAASAAAVAAQANALAATKARVDAADFTTTDVILGGGNTPIAVLASTLAPNTSAFDPRKWAGGALNALDLGVQTGGGGSLTLLLATITAEGQLAIYDKRALTVVGGTQTLAVSDSTLPGDIVLRPNTLVGFYRPSSGGAQISYSNSNIRADGRWFSFAGLPNIGDTITPAYNVAEVALAFELHINAVISKRKLRPVAVVQGPVLFGSTNRPLDLGVALGATWSGGYATMASAGIATSKLELWEATGWDGKVIRADFEFSATDQVAAILADASGWGGPSIINGSIGTADIANNLLSLYPVWNGTASLGTALQTATPGFTLAINHRYRMEMLLKAKVVTLRVIDLTSGAKAEIVQQPDIAAVSPNLSNKAGYLHGRAGVSLVSGGDGLRVYRLEAAAMVVDPDILIYGDSRSHANSVAWADCWPQLLQAALPGARILLDAIDGSMAQHVDLRHKFGLNLGLRPRYVLVNIGTNDNVLASWQAQIDAIRANIIDSGATPVFFTLPPRGGGYPPAGANDYLRSLSGIRLVQLDRALTVGADGVTKDTSLFAADGIHEIAAGHLADMNRIRIDLPELFDLYGAAA